MTGTFAAGSGVVGTWAEASGISCANKSLVRTPLSVGNDETVAC